MTKKTLEKHLPKKSDERLVNFKMPVDLHKQVKAKLKERKLTMKELMNGAVLAFISETKKSRE